MLTVSARRDNFGERQTASSWHDKPDALKPEGRLFIDGDMQMPVGGRKASGNGRDKCFDALLSHTRTKDIRVTIG